jgi:hypothetical protein
MRASEFVEDMFGVEPQRKMREGSRPKRGHNPVERYHKQSQPEEKLDELSFLGSECTKDCSGHRAGYDWSKRKGLRQGNSPYSPSFNKGAALAVAGR